MLGYRYFTHRVKCTHILARFDVFSAPGCRIELIPFALGQATQGTSLEYPQGLI